VGLSTSGVSEGEGPAGWARPLYAAVLDTADVTDGTALLDLGCGTGEFALAAADRGARVTGLDTDPTAVGLATVAVPKGRFTVGDAHDLGPVGPLGGPFAVVAALQLVTHVTNPLRVLREASRVAVPDGTLVATVWGREEECDVRVFGEALASWLPPRRRPPGPPSLTDPDRLRKLAWLAGLAVVGVDEVVCAFDYPDEAAVLDPLLVSAIGRAATARAGPDAVRRAVLDRLAPYRVAGGGYRLENLFRVLVSRCPDRATLRRR
jgi:SAM-dependent methyltransferase